MTIDEYLTFPLLSSPAFSVIMDAQTDDAGRFAAAQKLAGMSRDPMTRAAAILWCMRFIIAICDPNAKLCDILTIQRAQQHMDRMKNDPAACDHLRQYLRNF